MPYLFAITNYALDTELCNLVNNQYWLPCSSSKAQMVKFFCTRPSPNILSFIPTTNTLIQLLTAQALNSTNSDPAGLDS